MTFIPDKKQIETRYPVLHHKLLFASETKEEVLTWTVNGADLGYLGSFSKDKMHCSEENLEVFGLPALNISNLRNKIIMFYLKWLK